MGVTLFPGFYANLKPELGGIRAAIGRLTERPGRPAWPRHEHGTAGSARQSLQSCLIVNFQLVRD